MVNVGFIGCGNMGSAIMKGILSSKMSSDVKIFAYDKSEAALDKAMSMGVTGVSEAKDVVSLCNYVFFAIKPQQLDEVLDEAASAVTADTVIVSACVAVCVICNILLNTYFLYTLYVNKDFSLFNSDDLKGFGVYMQPRAIKNLIEIPIRSVVLIMILPVVKLAYQRVSAQFSQRRVKT